VISRRAATGVLLIALAIGLVALWQVSLRRLDFFAVRAVEVIGLRHLDEQALLDALGIPPGAQVAIDLEPVAERARAFAGVREATVTRRLPGTIVVRITEAPAVAIARRDDQVVVLDDRGAVLPVSPRRLTTPLPLTDGDSAVTALLGRLQEADPVWFATVDRATRDGGDALLTVSGAIIRLALGAPRSTLVELAAVRSWLERSHMAWTAIDARFAGRMFVRRSPS
jgi:cell division protein FtsQ